VGDGESGSAEGLRLRSACPIKARYLPGISFVYKNCGRRVELVIASKYMDNLLNIPAVRDFISVVQEGSFAAAARVLGVPKSTLSKRVQDLESSLGLRLIERTTRALRLTPDGALLFERARGVLSDIDELERLMRERNDAPKGLLRVSVPVLFGQAFLGRIAAVYTRQWPEATIEVIYNDRRVDLIEENFDCAIRLGPLEDSSLIVRPFALSRMVLVGAPQLFVQRVPPSMPDELADWPTISFAPYGTPVAWSFQRGDAAWEIKPRSAIILGNLYAVRDAAIRGGGLATIPEFIVADDIRQGRLDAMMADWHQAVEVSLVYPSRHNVSARLRAFIDIVLGSFPTRTLVNSSIAGGEC
jgi:LysR family transcriptional regulator for bpeEF and oprC